MTIEPELETYLRALRANLGSMTLSDREEIVREIQAHIRDAAEQGTSIAEVLTRLGSPAELSAQYRDGLLIRQASSSFSPVTLLRGALRMATKGLAGTVVFLAGLLGYTLGVGLVAGALLKPFFPNNVGWFVSQSVSHTQPVHNGLQSTMTYAAPPHELLGMWAIPLMLVLGSLTLLATTLLIRGVLREARRWQIRLQM